MAVGKSINSYYGDMDKGARPDIAMPNLDQAAPIHQVSNPWENQQMSQQPYQDHIMAPVPDELPYEVRQEMGDETSENTHYAKQSELLEELEPEQPTREQVSAQNRENIRALRERAERAERAERERDELMKLLMQQQQPKEQPKEQVYEDDLGIDDDSLLEGKYLKKVNKKVSNVYSEIEKLKRDAEEREIRYAQELADARLYSQYPDIKQVVTAENAQKLAQMDPDLFEMIMKMPYDKQVANAHKYIKQYGIHKEPSINKDIQRATQNVNKPKPVASVSPQQGATPLSKANAFANGEFTNEMKQQHLREMMNARKNH